MTKKIGSPCKHCGSTEKYVSSKSCVPCSKTRAKNNIKCQKSSPHIRRKLALASYHRRKDTPKYKEARRSIDANKNAKRRLRTGASLAKSYSEEINRIYKECPDGMQVDHIVPLNGKNVSGLHVPWNLQYLTPEENLGKSNKFKV